VTLLEAIAVTAAGFAAGGVNAIVGSGSLITFPVLLAVGYPSVVANVSNTVGLVPGGISGVIGYRRELRGQWRRASILACGTAPAVTCSVSSVSKFWYWYGTMIMSSPALIDVVMSLR